MPACRQFRDPDACVAAWVMVAGQVRAAATEALGREPAGEANAAAGDPGAESAYLAVIGTSAGTGDDGRTGRDKRVNGVIAPARPMTIESLAGKDLVTQVGKIYHVAATRIARAIVPEIEGAGEAHVLLVRRIGAPIAEPQVVDVRLRADDSMRVREPAAHAREITRRHVDGIGNP